MFRNFFINLFLIFIAYSTLSFNGLKANEQPRDNSKPSLCLTMIVKNESRIIKRCLDSVKDIIDCISICDTGSTDNTVEIIELFMKENNIPGKVHRHEWKNFGHNRTLSALAAQKTLDELHFSLPQTYLLLLDADMMLEVSPEFKPEMLTLDSYYLIQQSPSLSYYNTRLIRASLPWECVGVTHEYWSCKKSPQISDKLQTLMINDRDDGGCKADKFERDIKLLTQGLKDEPENVRYMFYCAQSHKALKQYDEALRWYKNRIDKGGWKEEVWYAKFMIGECYEEMGYWDHALHWYLDAYQFNPDRAETLQKIATHYRHHGENSLAHLFAKHGFTIPYPENQMLFITHPVYDYQFDEELSIASYYTNFKNEGFSAANRLILKKNVPQYIKDSTYKNLLFYVENLKNANFSPIQIDLPLIREGSNERYYPMNPSIQKTKEGYTLIVRTVNFSQKDGKEYRSRDPLDETIKTRNFLVKYDQNFKLLSQQEIVEDLPREKIKSRVTGLEDCRLAGNDWFTTVVYDVPPGNVIQALCKFAYNPDKKQLQVSKLIPLKGPDPNRCEKNWLPFMMNKNLYAVYSYHPFLIYKLNEQSGDCETLIRYEPNHDFSHFRGSASPIEFDNGYLLLVHEVVFADKRFYLHRFVYLDKDFKITKVSKPFTFMHKGTEYCCGMTTDHANSKCILTIGIEDQQAFFCFLDLDNVRTLLEPLP